MWGWHGRRHDWLWIILIGFEKHRWTSWADTTSGTLWARIGKPFRAFVSVESGRSQSPRWSSRAASWRTWFTICAIFNKERNASPTAGA
jgi:hypothetical protein